MPDAASLLLGALVGAGLLMLGMELGKRWSKSYLSAAQATLTAAQQVQQMLNGIAESAALSHRIGHHLERQEEANQRWAERIDTLTLRLENLDQILTSQATSRQSPRSQTSSPRPSSAPPMPKIAHDPQSPFSELWEHREPPTSETSDSSSPTSPTSAGSPRPR